jgi:CheY-like chemotaxis protein
MPRTLRPLSQRQPRRAVITAEQLASLSHEFRTPLNGVIGMARLLEGTRLTAEQGAYAKALRDSGEHLLTLVNDVLDFAKLGAAGVELHRSEVNLQSMLGGVCELMSPRAAEKGLEVAWVSEAAGAIHGDESRIRQILLNFAGNGVKFTRDGGVLVSVAPRGQNRLRFTVEDTGPGVAQAQRERIFEAFAQADAAHADLGGAGLGLAIARRLAQAMDGDVGVEPARSGGAAFWFEAPFRTYAKDRGPPPLAGRTVGVASPNPIVREAARRQIRALGGTPVSAAGLDEVLSRTAPEDVVLVSHAVAQNRRAGNRRLIVLLSPEERERIAQYRRLGWAGYLIKPLRQGSLAERVLIAAGAETGDGHAVVEDERIVAAAAPGVRVLLVEDNPINALLARALLAREGCAVDHAPCGEDAMAACKASAYDLILMDMRMPGMSGEETARALRKAGVGVPIVALTANAFEEDRQACLAAGMNDFLVKPMSPDALRAMLTRWAARGWTLDARQAKFG